MRLVVELTDEDHRKIKTTCAEQGISMKQFVLRAIKHCETEQYADRKYEKLLDFSPASTKSKNRPNQLTKDR